MERAVEASKGEGLVRLARGGYERNLKNSNCTVCSVTEVLKLCSSQSIPGSKEAPSKPASEDLCKVIGPSPLPAFYEISGTWLFFYSRLCMPSIGSLQLASGD